jgi:hypothetical protein
VSPLAPGLAERSGAKEGGAGLACDSYVIRQWLFLICCSCSSQNLQGTRYLLLSTSATSYETATISAKATGFVVFATTAGALAEQGEAGSGRGRRPLPCQCGSGAIAHVWVSQTASKRTAASKVSQAGSRKTRGGRAGPGSGQPQGTWRAQ